MTVTPVGHSCMLVPFQEDFIDLESGLEFLNGVPKFGNVRRVNRKRGRPNELFAGPIRPSWDAIVGGAAVAGGFISDYFKGRKRVKKSDAEMAGRYGYRRKRSWKKPVVRAATKGGRGSRVGRPVRVGSRKRSGAAVAKKRSPRVRRSGRRMSRMSLELFRQPKKMLVEHKHFSDSISAYGKQQTFTPGGSSNPLGLGTRYYIDACLTDINNVSTTTYFELFLLSDRLDMDIYNPTNVIMYCTVFWCLAKVDGGSTNTISSDPTSSWSQICDQAPTTVYAEGTTDGTTTDPNILGNKPFFYRNFKQMWKILRVDSYKMGAGATRRCSMTRYYNRFVNRWMQQNAAYNNTKAYQTVVPMITYSFEMIVDNAAAATNTAAFNGGIKIQSKYKINYKAIDYQYNAITFTEASATITTPVTVNPYTDAGVTPAKFGFS